jgi:phosphopantothenoylcysteine synthetase/decarboxylase
MMKRRRRMTNWSKVEKPLHINVRTTMVLLLITSRQDAELMPLDVNFKNYVDRGDTPPSANMSDSDDGYDHDEDDDEEEDGDDDDDHGIVSHLEMLKQGHF